MSRFAPPLLAEAGHPLFGNAWLALLVVLVGVGVFMFAIAAIGRWLAATHPEPLPRPSAATAGPGPAGPAPEILAVIAASIAASFGPRARIAAIQTAKPPNVEMLMQQWSLEGRRQIYSSHQVR